MAGEDIAHCAVCDKRFKWRAGKANKFCSLSCYRVEQRRGAYATGPRDTTHREPCAGCGSLVVRIRGHKRDGTRADRLFCGRDCYDRFRASEIQSRMRPCAHCGASFDPKTRGKFCGEDCWKAARKAKPIKCVNCGAHCTPLKWFPSRQRYATANGVKTCSNKCALERIANHEGRKQKISEAFSGDRHPNWQGGKALLNSTSNRGPGWQKQRRRALKRDGFACVDCGISQDDCRAKYGRGLDVDHIEPFHNFGNSVVANRLSNLACRCTSCHRKAEAKRVGVQMVLPYAKVERARRREAGAFERAGL